MKRVIKFRGKRVTNGEWAYGSILMQGSGRMCIYDETQCMREVQPDTVGQFTGLYDANGKEIYEGDVMFIGEVDGIKIYNEVRIKFGCFGCIGEITGELVPFYGQDITETVAGNIHDNPELLKGGNDGQTAE